MPATETRARILEVARGLFCQQGFDQLGVRELAAAARVDPAIVIRLFGSKEALFETVAAGAFGLEAPFDGPLEGLGLRIAEHLMGKKDAEPEDDFDDFRFLLHSAASATAGPILAKALHAAFIVPLAKHLGGRDAKLRAAVLASGVLGFVTLRIALGSPALEDAPPGRVSARLGAMLQACIDA